MPFSVKKENGQLIFTDHGGYETRNPCTIWCITEADKIYKWKDFKEIKVFTTDVESNETLYAYSNRSLTFKNLVPDWNFHAWKEVGIDDYDQTVKHMDELGRQPYSINKVGWIGNINTNGIRREGLKIGDKHPELFDMFDCGNWWSNGQVKLQNKKYISLPELIQTYSVLIDFPGAGFSARVKHLLWSHRPLLLVNRITKEYYYEHLKEWEHYIPVNSDLSDLVEKAQWCIDNYDKAKIIAENAYE
jgi:Glycosyl transferase family 90